jgi:formylglycine-generating enzyme required for sulfatase activity
VHGNIDELCLDGMDGTFYRRCLLGPVVDPVAPAVGPSTCSSRGGTFWDRAVFARSAKRNFRTIEQAAFWAGLRPAREISGEVRHANEGAEKR